MILANSEIRVKLSDKLINVFLTCINVFTPKNKLELGTTVQKQSCVLKYAFYLVLNIDAHNAFMFYQN